MDTTCLQSSSHKLIDFMASHGYKDYRCSTLCEVKNWIDLALTLDPSLEVNSYEDLFKVGLRQHRQDLKEPRLSMLERSLAIVRDFDLFGKYPSRMKFDAKKVLEEYCHLPLQFKQIASYHFENGSRTGRTIETIIREYRSLLRFFSHLYSNGARSIFEATQPFVSTYFHDGTKQVRGKSSCAELVLALKNVADQYEEESTYLLKLLPSIKVKHKIFVYLTSEEREKILTTLSDPNTMLSHRDRAIGMMLFFWGIRGSDIISLQMSNIDWKNDKIKFVQSKTGNNIELPLNAAIGNALFDYITSERPQIESDFVFLSSRAPYFKIKAIYQTTSNIYKAAGINNNQKPRGARIFRHNMVTSLLQLGEESQVVSSIVGHKKPESLLPYVDTDEQNLVECALSISDFPLDEKYFDNEDYLHQIKSTEFIDKIRKKNKKTWAEIPLETLSKFALSIEDYPLNYNDFKI